MNISNICNFCSKEFTNRVNLLQHQKTVKSCLKLQGKKENEIEMECFNCKKILSIKYYKKHKTKCDEKQEKMKKEKEKEENEEKQEKQEIDNYKNKIISFEKEKIKREKEINNYKYIISVLEKENEKQKGIIMTLEKQIEKLNSISENVTIKLAEKTNTINNNKTVVINTNPPLTNEILRHYANTFTIDNAYNINGITNHLTSSLENHIICTDPSRNIFKYTNEKDEEIIDKDLEILLPHYLTSIKDRNNFLYKEVFEYFKTNNVPVNIQTDYKIFYDALNGIINKSGQSRYTEKCKQHMVRECKRRFLEKNKNKDKEITKKLSVEEVMKNIIETGGTVNDFIKILFPTFLNEDLEETDDEIKYRRDMEDMFIKKKREWKEYKDENKDENKEE